MSVKEHEISVDEVKLLIREGEGLTVEFKERYTTRIDEDIVTFANAKGGTLFLGVRDEGATTGEALTNDLKAKINSLARNCKPAIALNLSQVGDVVAIIVPEGTEKPCSCGSGYFRRLDGSTQKVSHDEMRIMFAENEPLPFEERTVKGFTFDDISRTKINVFAKEAGIRIGSTTVADFLRSLKVADAAHVKNARILFFAKEVYEHIHHAQMTLLAFKGTDRLHIYDRRDVRDDLLTQFNEAVAFLKKHLNISSEIRGVDREDIYEIPLEVLREALVNALMHHDYNIAGTRVNVEVFDDRVEVVNPGRLPKGLSLQDLGRVSVRRNELIADLFFRLHKVERIGTGIQKMKESMAAAGLGEPTFEPEGFFRAVFRRSPEFALKEGTTLPDRVSAELVEGLADRLVEGLAENQRRMLTMIAGNPRVSKKGMAESLGISTTAIDKNLNVLKRKRILRRVGPDKGGHWEVVREASGSFRRGGVNDGSGE